MGRAVQGPYSGRDWCRVPCFPFPEAISRTQEGMTNTAQSRVLAGVRSGCEFAATAHSEKVPSLGGPITAREQAFVGLMSDTLDGHGEAKACRDAVVHSLISGESPVLAAWCTRFFERAPSAAELSYIGRHRSTRRGRGLLLVPRRAWGLASRSSSRARSAQKRRSTGPALSVAGSIPAPPPADVPILLA